MTPLDDLTLLRSLVRIVDSGGLSAAARIYKVPQPSLSRHLRQLEERCGVTLVSRDTHGIHLTEAGQRLCEDARELLTMAETAAQRMRDEQSMLRGHLRVFATIDFGQSLVTRLVAGFLQSHPGMTAELNYTNRPAGMVEEGFDAAVVAGDLKDDRVVARCAGRVTRHLVTSPAYREQKGEVWEPEDLLTWTWVQLGGNLFGRSGEILLQTAGNTEAKAARRVVLKPSAYLTCEGVTSMREALACGTGVAVLPDWLVHADLREGRLVQVLSGWEAPPLAVHVIFPASRPPVQRVRAFVEYAVHFMETELAKVNG